MRITALAGGVGGARFLRGLLHHLGPDASGPDPTVTVIGNTADDLTLHGLRVCPDLDTVMYTLGGGIHEGQGWGRSDETFSAAAELAAYGSGPDWFTLGDRDLATHVVRTRLLGQGRTLSEVTAALCERWQPGVRLLPMSDDRVETHVVIDDPDRPAVSSAVSDGAGADRRAVHFQEWWVRLHAAVPARQILAVGIEQALPAPGVLEAIATADVILLPPSNPVVSIGTILGVPGHPGRDPRRGGAGGRGVSDHRRGARARDGGRLPDRDRGADLGRRRGRAVPGLPGRLAGRRRRCGRGRARRADDHRPGPPAADGGPGHRRRDRRCRPGPGPGPARRRASGRAVTAPLAAGQPDAPTAVPTLQAFGLAGIGEVRPGDDLAGLILTALAAGRPEALRDGDIVVVSSKIVSKAEGRTLHASSREAAVQGETVRVVAERETPRGLTRIVASRSGPVLAAAGVDASNVEPGTVLLLPADPDASARALRADLAERTGLRIGVLVTDTLGRPWRDGQADAAIGVAGVLVTEDLRGRVDGYGNPLEVTVRAVADELAGLADLVKGKLSGIPVAVVGGLGELVTEADGPGAAALLRSPAQDWFRYGHVEAVRAALGVPPGGPGIPPSPVESGTVRQRLQRALAVALAGPGWRGLPADPRAAVTVSLSEPGASQPPSVTLRPADGVPAPGTAAILLGALAQRLQAAAWAEDLDVDVEVDLEVESGEGSAAVVVRVCSAG